MTTITEINLKNSENELPESIRKPLTSLTEESYEALHLYLQYHGMDANDIEDIYLPDETNLRAGMEVIEAVEMAYRIAVGFGARIHIQVNGIPVTVYTNAIEAAMAAYNERLDGPSDDRDSLTGQPPWAYRTKTTRPKAEEDILDEFLKYVDSSHFGAGSKCYTFQYAVEAFRQRRAKEKGR